MMALATFFALAIYNEFRSTSDHFVCPIISNLSRIRVDIWSIFNKYATNRWYFEFLFHSLKISPRFMLMLLRIIEIPSTCNILFQIFLIPKYPVCNLHSLYCINIVTQRFSLALCKLEVCQPLVNRTLMVLNWKPVT